MHSPVKINQKTPQMKQAAQMYGMDFDRGSMTEDSVSNVGSQIGGYSAEQIQMQINMIQQ